MKRIYILLLSLSTKIMLLAQEGKLRTEDYMDYSDFYPNSYSSSDDKLTGYICLGLLIAMGIGILWFKSALNSSRNEEIRNKTQFLANWETFAFDTVSKAMSKSNRIYPIKEFFTMENGIVKIPKYAKCIILEYYSENRSYVKVQFDKYPQPLYMERCNLRTPKEITLAKSN